MNDKGYNNIAYKVSIDLGSRYIVCLMTVMPPLRQETLSHYNLKDQILALAIVDSRGIRHGVVANQKQACAAIKEAIMIAEKQSGLPIKEAALVSSGGTPRAISSETALSLAGKPIEQKHIRQLYHNAGNIPLPSGRYRIDMASLGYSIDDELIDTDPIGQTGHKINLALSLIHADKMAVRNNILALRKNNVRVTSYHFSPAAFIPLCNQNYYKNPITVIVDFGAGVTGVAVILNKKMIDVVSFPTGGNDITDDIAMALSIDRMQADMIKQKNSFALTNYQPLDQKIQGDDDLATLARLPSITTPRIEEIFKSIKQFLTRSRITNHGDYAVVLCGGSSLIPGLAPLATQILNCSVFPFRPPFQPWISGRWHSTIWAVAWGISQTREYKLEYSKKTLPGNHAMARFFAPFLHHKINIAL